MHRPVLFPRYVLPSQMRTDKVDAMHPIVLWWSRLVTVETLDWSLYTPNNYHHINVRTLGDFSRWI